MAGHITSPVPQDLLPPLFACLPTAYASPRPPPALLPLLSPILRQRVQYLSTTASTSDSWLPLLCWDTHQATRVVGIVGSEALEPHPVSGEIEIPDVKEIRYRRLDSETLHAQIVLADIDLSPSYLWCEVDSERETNGWRLAELSPGSMGFSNNTWWQSMDEANRAYEEKQMAVDHGIKETVLTVNGRAHGSVEEEDEDDYWASYDKTPGKTPGMSKQHRFTNGDDHGIANSSDADYYARYADTQPALDNDDPSEHHTFNGESTLHGDTVASAFSQPIENPLSPTPITFPDHLRDHKPQHVDSPILEHPRPASSASSGSATVDRLEASASNHFMAEQAISSHISTSFKSLFRLARNSGMERVEFVRRIRAELETLPMIDHED